MSLVLVFGFGVILGFRPHGSPLAALAGCGLIMLFTFAVSWISALVAMLAKSAASVQGLAFVLIFPLTFGSNVFVPTAQLPGWLQAWVKVNPVTQVSDAARGLLLDLPLGGTLTTSLLWTAAILMIFAPLAVRAYRRQA